MNKNNCVSSVYSDQIYPTGHPMAMLSSEPDAETRFKIYLEMASLDFDIEKIRIVKMMLMRHQMGLVIFTPRETARMLKKADDNGIQLDWGTIKARSIYEKKQLALKTVINAM